MWLIISQGYFIYLLTSHFKMDFTVLLVESEHCAVNPSMTCRNNRIQEQDFIDDFVKKNSAKEMRWRGAYAYISNWTFKNSVGTHPTNKVLA